MVGLSGPPPICETVKSLLLTARAVSGSRSDCKMISDRSLRESPSQLEYPLHNDARHAFTVITQWQSPPDLIV